LSTFSRLNRWLALKRKPQKQNEINAVPTGENKLLYRPNEPFPSGNLFYLAALIVSFILKMKKRMKNRILCHNRSNWQ